MVKLYTALTLLILTLSSNGDEYSSNKNVNTEELTKELFYPQELFYPPPLGKIREQIKSIVGDHYYYSDTLDLFTEPGYDISVEAGTVYVLGGDDDPDSNPNFKPDYSFGGKDDPDNMHEFNPGKPMPGGKDDLDNTPEFYPGKPMFGGKGDPDWHMKRGRDPRKQTIRDATEEDMPMDMFTSSYPTEHICEDYECPKFKVIGNPSATCGFDIETRVYFGGKWIMTEFSAGEDSDLKEIFITSAMKLQMYTNGANSDGAAIPMTAPLVVNFVMDPANIFIPTGGTVMLWIPVEYQNDTPQPTDPEVSIFIIPDGNYTRYVRAFGTRFPEPYDFMREFKILEMCLKESGIKFAIQYPTILDYLPHWDIRQRHEVMYGGDDEMSAITQELQKKRGEKKNEEGSYKAENIERKGDHKLPPPYPIDEMCKDVECPPYTVVPLPKGASGFDMRKYTAAKWVMTDMTDEEIKNPQGGFNESLAKLSGYMEGQNEEKIKIKMTLPVVFIWFQDPSEPKSGRLQFYLPAEYQDNPPEPTNPDLEVDTQDEVVVMLRALGGHPSPADWSKEFMVLVSGIISGGIECVVWDSPIIAGYSDMTGPRIRTEIMLSQCEFYKK